MDRNGYDLRRVCGHGNTPKNTSKVNRDTAVLPESAEKLQSLDSTMTFHNETHCFKPIDKKDVDIIKIKGIEDIAYAQPESVNSL